MKEEKKATRQSYGETLEKLGEKYKDISLFDVQEYVHSFLGE